VWCEVVLLATWNFGMIVRLIPFASMAYLKTRQTAFLIVTHDCDEKALCCWRFVHCEFEMEHVLTKLRY
jgi:hypothetical protein